MNQRDQPVDAVRLRPVGPADLPALFEIQADPESNVMAGTKSRTREVFFTVWERNFVDAGVNACVIEIDGASGSQLVGSIARFQADGHDCVGYWIARAHWGKGIASRALALFLEQEHRRPLRATTAGDNAPSRHILQKCGFRFVGVRMGEETDRFVAREVAEFELE
ncbi:MAG: GNAT family N-acetyltransferase [Phycisphaerae bacterium]